MVLCFSQLCMPFIATYLAIQIKCILLARFRFESGKSKVTACLRAATLWMLRLRFGWVFHEFFFFGGGGNYFFCSVCLCVSKITFFSPCSLTTEAFNSHLAASGFDTFLGSVQQLGTAALLPEVFLAELWASKGILPLTEANAAPGVMESLCTQCFWDIFHLLQLWFLLKHSFSIFYFLFLTGLI